MFLIGYRKLKATIDEYNTRIGQQAVVLCVTPGKMSQSINAFKVFGSQPLEGVVSGRIKSFVVSQKNCYMKELYRIWVTYGPLKIVKIEV